MSVSTFFCRSMRSSLDSLSMPARRLNATAAVNVDLLGAVDGTLKDGPTPPASDGASADAPIPARSSASGPSDVKLMPGSVAKEGTGRSFGSSPAPKDASTSPAENDVLPSAKSSTQDASPCTVFCSSSKSFFKHGTSSLKSLKLAMAFSMAARRLFVSPFNALTIIGS